MRTSWPSARLSWLLRIVWALVAVTCLTAMIVYPSRETIPFHLLWIGLSLVYGFAVWRPIELAATVIVLSGATTVILIHHALHGYIHFEEVFEVPLSVVLIIVIAAHIRRRHIALTQLADRAALDRRQAEKRQEMMRRISHELRTPITVARGYTELVRERSGDRGTAEDTQVVLEELDKLAEISRRLISMIQMDAPPGREPVDLDVVLERIVRRWIPAADREWSVGSPPGQVLANRDRLEAALDCLLDNAVKFTRPGDRIGVTGSIDRQSWAVEVADSGPGLAAAASHPAAGTGLGLATVRAVVESWDGTVTLRDREGGGTVATLRFPVAV